MAEIIVRGVIDGNCDDCFDGESHRGRFPPGVHFFFDGKYNSVLDSSPLLPAPPVIRKPFSIVR